MEHRFKCLQILLICLSLLCGCNQKSPSGSASVRMGVDIGPLEVGINIDTDGNVAFVSGFSRRFRLSLGPIGLSIGVEQTLSLTQSKPYYLFILWQDSSGNIQRDEYVIGRQFRVRFNRQEWVREITGLNDSVIVAVDRNSFQPKNSKEKGKIQNSTDEYSDEELDEEFTDDEEVEDDTGCSIWEESPSQEDVSKSIQSKAILESVNSYWSHLSHYLKADLHSEIYDNRPRLLSRQC